MRVQRQVLDDRRDAVVEFVVECDRLSDNISRAEVLDRRFLRDHYIGWRVQSRFIPVDELEVENLQQLRIGEPGRLIEAVRAAAHQVFGPDRTRCQFDIRNLRFDDWCDRRKGTVHAVDTEVHLRRGNGADDVGAIAVFVERIVRLLVIDEQEPEHVNRHADRKAQYIDCGVSLVLAQVADRDCQVVPEHDLLRLCLSCPLAVGCDVAVEKIDRAPCIIRVCC